MVLTDLDSGPRAKRSIVTKLCALFSGDKIQLPDFDSAAVIYRVMPTNRALLLRVIAERTGYEILRPPRGHRVELHLIQTHFVILRSTGRLWCGAFERRWLLRHECQQRYEE